MELLRRHIDYGENVEEVVRTDDCQVLRLNDATGEGMMTTHLVFPGVYLMYNDFHLTQCFSEFQTDAEMLAIDHCREGRIQHEVTRDAFGYLEPGNLRVDSRAHHTGQFFFPLGHYHGIGISFQLEVAAKALPQQMLDFPVSLHALREKYCGGESHSFIIPSDPAIEHIFSELYHVPSKIRKDYFRIKVLELLLYLDALELSEHREERPYFYRGQVEKIKAAQAFLTENLATHYTVEELSERFDIALTPLKACFKNVYGSPVFTYMRDYRMNHAATLLRKNSDLSVSEIAGRVGYDSPSKFSAAFRQVMGRAPLEYRKSLQ